jgi:hypothetical protein
MGEDQINPSKAFGLSHITDITSILNAGPASSSLVSTSWAPGHSTLDPRQSIMCQSQR